MQRRPTTRSEAAGARRPSASGLAPALAEPTASEKGGAVPAPHRPALRAGGTDALRTAASDSRATPEARGYGAG